MHYPKLAGEVVTSGGDIAGVISVNTLVARLACDSLFVRPTRRGYFELRADYPDEESVVAHGLRVNSNNG